MLSFRIGKKIHVSVRPCMQCTSYFSSGVPKPPKNPGNSFLIYMSEQIPVLKAKDPGVSMAVLAQKCGEQYRQLSESEKDVYRQKMKVRYLEYQRQLEKFNESLSPEEKKELEIEKVKHKEKKLKERRRKLLKETGCPTRPPTEYALFLQSKMKQTGSSKSLGGFKEMSKSMAEEWKQLSDDEKQVYRKEAERLMEEYQENLMEYEKNMIGEGKLDLVRKASLPPDVKKQQQRKNKAAKLRNLAKEMGCPVRPLTSYQAFQVDMAGKGLKPGELVEAFNNLDAKKKQNYHDHAAKQKAKYEESLAKWEGEMVKKGLYELVRKSKLPADVKVKRNKKSKTASKGKKVDEDPSWMREE